MSDTRGTARQAGDMGTKAVLGMLCQGCWGHVVLWRQDGDRVPKLSSGHRAVSELCQGPSAVTPGWGHWLGAKCQCRGLGTLCHGARLVTPCLETLCHGDNGLGTVCPSQRHRTILGTLWHRGMVLAATLGTLSPSWTGDSAKEPVPGWVWVGGDSVPIFQGGSGSVPVLWGASGAGGANGCGSLE